MSKQNTINSLEEALRILWLQSARDATIDLSERELRLILTSADETFDMDKNKKEELINRLFHTVNNVSMGSLIAEAMTIKKVNEESISKDAKIPLNIMKSLIADEIFPNNVPIMLFKSLLDKLDISFKTAETAIIKTFEIVKTREFINLEPHTYRVSARRHQDEKGRMFINKKGETEGRELYENRDSLTKYIRKLEDLMTNIHD